MIHLVADVGGTNARFRLSDGQSFCSDRWTTSTAEFTQGSVLFEAACEGLGVAQSDLRSVVAALAGPVKDGAVKMTNSALHFDAAECSRMLNCPVQLVNDFYGLAAGVPYFYELEQFGGGIAQDTTKAILGPGSGLGMATVTPAADGAWQVLAGEGGHADLAPGNHLEGELWNVLTAKFGHVSWETVLCGPGLVNLYEAMCATWGSPAETLTPADITAMGQDMSDLVCHQTLEVFAGLLGAAAGNLALVVGARGGVYLGGGIVPRMTEFLKTSALRRRFDDKGSMSHYVEDIPLYAVLDEDPGLIGAQACIVSKDR